MIPLLYCPVLQLYPDPIEGRLAEQRDAGLFGVEGRQTFQHIYESDLKTMKNSYCFSVFVFLINLVKAEPKPGCDVRLLRQ